VNSWHLDKGNSLCQINPITSENGLKTFLMAREFTSFLTAALMKANSSKEESKARENSQQLQAISFTKAHSLTIASKASA
jgi:hypothetical protein